MASEHSLESVDQCSCNLGTWIAQVLHINRMGGQRQRTPIDTLPDARQDQWSHASEATSHEHFVGIQSTDNAGYHIADPVASLEQQGVCEFISALRSHSEVLQRKGGLCQFLPW